LREILGDVFGFHIEERVDDVGDGRVILDVIHPDCCCDDWIGGEIPVRICSLRMKSRSRAAEISPR
jgi:hypothetical protein